jgi:uncharacterized coiled-coil protein SlyX
MILPVITIVGWGASAYLYWKLRTSNVSVFEKDGIIEALQKHSRSVENVLDRKQEDLKRLHNELNALKSSITAKAKAKTAPASKDATATSSKPKRRYNRKPKAQ